MHAEQSGDADGDEGTNTDETASEGTTHIETQAEASGHSESSAETVLGVNLESDAVVTVAATVSLALAALSWFRNRRAVLFATTVFAIGFVVFDVAEVVHQIRESRSGLATLAAAIAVLHIATAVVAERARDHTVIEQLRTRSSPFAVANARRVKTGGPWLPLLPLLGQRIDARSCHRNDRRASALAGGPGPCGGATCFTKTGAAAAPARTDDHRAGRSNRVGAQSTQGRLRDDQRNHSRISRRENRDVA